MNKITTKVVNRLFKVKSFIHSQLPSKKKFKILFSDLPRRRLLLERVFQFTKHQISFGNISQSNLKNYDLIVPLTIHDLKYLNEVKDLIIDNPIPIPSTSSIITCDEKNRLNSALIESGFSHIVPKIGGKQKFPYIIKRNTDETGQNSHIVHDLDEELHLSSILGNPDYYTQEIIVGKYEYAAHILIKDYIISYHLGIRYTFDNELPIHGKDWPIDTRTCHCPYLDLFASILNSIGFQGLCCIDYKVYNNHPYIFEINPRPGGSCHPYFLSFINHLD